MLSRLPTIFVPIVLLSSIVLPSRAAGLSTESSPTSLSRENEIVVIPGTVLGALHERTIAELRLFAFDSRVGAFEPIPFQIDQRFDRTFNEGTPFAFTELVYDVSQADDGLLDGQDELAFRFGDAGDRAAEELPWPTGADTVRIELKVQDSRPGSGSVRWAYLFAGAELPTSEDSYITWGGGPTDPVVTARFELEYEGPWLLTGLRVPPPCGSGSDIIDRVKGRARPLLGNREDEEGWSSNSTYLGGIAGPVRAIRYVRGATSAVNTIHRDIVTLVSWTRTINLRVHPLVEVEFYLDLLPDVNASLFWEAKPSGTTIDGVPDTGISQTFSTWALYRGPAGGLVTLYSIPPSDRYDGPLWKYADDAALNDQIPQNPIYTDDDDSAYGVHGFVISNVAESNLEAHPLELTWYPLCANEGDASLGEAHAALVEYPISAEGSAQVPGLAAIRDLLVVREQTTAVFRWSPVPGALGYRIYVASDPSLPRELWSLDGEVTLAEYRRSVGSGIADPGFYSVVAFDASGEGAW